MKASDSGPPRASAAGAFRLGRAAELLGVSTDTLRRWADSGRVAATRDAEGRRTIAATELARFVSELAARPEPDVIVGQSARNRFSGIVTRVVKDKVTALVEMQAGPHRIVSLMTREAVDELGLEPGMLAIAAVKATSVIVEVPGER